MTAVVEVGADRFAKRMSKSAKTKLTAAANDGEIVGVFRGSLEEGHLHGYVAAVGAAFFALQVIDDSIRFNGISCIRFTDVTKVVAPDPYAGFLIKALKARGEKRGKIKSIDLSSTHALVATAAKHYPLVTIHLEKAQPDVCYIGKILSVTDSKLTLLHVSPGAKWESSPEHYSLAEITRIDFGGAYEEALYLVAGEPTN